MRPKILVTGAYGFLGTHLCKRLEDQGYKPIKFRSYQCDLRNKIQVEYMFYQYKPDIVIHLAARVGGIGANLKNPGLFMYDNLSMGLNVIEAARLTYVEKFIMMGTICCYPKYTKVPFKEEDLWLGYPEESNAPYGIGKKTLMELLIAYNKQYNFNAINLMSVNLFGPGDSTDLENNHVIPAIIHKVCKAQFDRKDNVTIWGTGSASREFLYVDDCVDAIVLALEKDDVGPQPINVGTGKEISIRDLTQLICKLMEYDGEIRYDISKPDGQPRRCLDVSKAKQLLGFEAKTDLETGLKETIRWFYDQFSRI